jgi:hypothetical protein
MINKKEKIRAEVENFETNRIYTARELEDFHNNIQRFWIGDKFLNEELHVAYGAAIKRDAGRRPDGTRIFYYTYNSERYEQFRNLWKQYERWRVNREYQKEEKATAEPAPVSSLAASIF